MLYERALEKVCKIILISMNHAIEQMACEGSSKLNWFDEGVVYMCVIDHLMKQYD